MSFRTTPQVYTPHAGDVTIPGATAIHEFFGFAGDCGQAAGEILYAWSQFKKPSGPHINAVVRAMQGAGLASSSGVSSLQGNSIALKGEGVPNMTTSDWLGALHANAGVKPVELGVTHAGVLPGDQTNVFGHFLSVEGRTKSGDYIVSDPDNAAAKTGQLVTYSEAQLAAAHPWGAIVPTGGGPGIAPSAGGPPQMPYVPFLTPQAVQAQAQATYNVVQDINRAGHGLQDPAGFIGNAVAGWVGPLVMTVLVFFLALAAIGIGALLIFHEPIQQAAGKVGDAAKATAVVGA